MSQSPRRIHTGAVANQLTRAVIAGKRIEVVKNEKGTVDVWVAGEYLGWVEKDLAEEILSRD